jgi:hypothetical protein
LDTRTKHTVAKDRLIVAEQRIIDIERRKSASNLQLLAFEQKQLEKRLSSLHNLDRSLQMHRRSINEANVHQTISWNQTLETTHINLHHSNQNLLSLPKFDNFQRTYTAYSDGDISINPISNSDPESGDEDNSKSIKNKSILPPIVAVIPPEGDMLFLVQ